MAALCYSCDSPETATATATATKDTSFVSVDLPALPEDFWPPSVAVEITKDHSLHTRKRYEAYPLRPVLDRLIEQYDLDTATTQVVLVCQDDYLASNTLQELYAADGGYLAFRDLDAPAGSNWPPALAHYAPFYLVWEDLPYDDHRLTWPFGLVALRFSTQDPYASLFPHEQPELTTAFDNYKANCLKCHSLNKLGGHVGPEFNVPTNITEYWTRDNIVAFAQNPQSFRYNSKMYAIEHLSHDELHDIVSYLAYMADHKVAAP